MDEFIEPKAKIETEFFLATVAEVDDEDGISIIPEGQTSATGKKYKMLINGGFTPEAGDRVVVLKQSGTFVILGKIGYPEDNTGGGGVIYPIAVDKGGTGATTAAAARTNLGAAAANAVNSAHLYFDPAELNLTGTPTMKEVVDAMPNHSIGVFSNSMVDQTGMTQPFTIIASDRIINNITIFKITQYRAYAIGNMAYYGVTEDKAFFAFAGYNGNAWVGWMALLKNMGDIMTGSLHIRGNYVSNGSYNANQYSTQLILDDSEGTNIGMVRTTHYSGGVEQVEIFSRRKVSDTDYYNSLMLRIAADGTRSINFTDVNIWRKALGLGNSSGNLPITTAQGGTGVDASTAAGKIAAMNNLGGVKQIQLTGMTASTTASLISAMSAGIGSIPVGPSFVVCGDSNVSARAVVVFQKTGTNTGKGFVISPFAALYNKWITDSNGTWTTYGPETLIQTTTVNQIATAASGWQITSASYSERGRIAQVEINIKTTAQKTITNTDPIATIVSGKRPVADSPCQVWLSTSRNAIIKPDGTICTNAGTINSGTAFTLLAIYLVNA